MMKRLMFLVLSLAVLIGMGLATSAAIAGEDGPYGQVRWRWEGFKDYDGNSDFADGWAHSLLRSRLGYFTHVGERAMVNISMENVTILGGDWGYGYYDPFGANDYETKFYSGLDFGHDIYIHNAWLGYQDFLFEDFDVYAGRMTLKYGRERIIGPEDWSMDFQNRFDGFKGHYSFEDGWFDLLCLKLMEAGPTRYNDTFDEAPGRGDLDLRGAYLHYNASEELWFEPYVMMMTQNHSDYGTDFAQDPPDRFPGLDSDNYFIFGALVDYMNDTGLHFYGEATVESGTEHYGTAEDQTDADYSALGFYGGLFYQSDSEYEPFLGVEFNYASGTKLDDDKYKTFFSPFGSVSNFMGRMNFVGWSNTASWRLSGGLTPTEDFDVKIDFYLFKLAQDEDFAYFNHTFGNWINDPMTWPGERDENGAFDKSVGTEIDIFLNYAMDEGFDLEGGLGIFSAGDYFGPDADIDKIWFSWLGATVGF
jgi:hypothetical protein